MAGTLHTKLGETELALRLTEVHERTGLSLLAQLDLVEYLTGTSPCPPQALYLAVARRAA